MLNHISIGVSSIATAKAFYDATLKPLGYRCLSEDSASLGYGSERVVFWVLKSDKPVSDDAASGLHVCFDAPTTASVDRFHAAGLRRGGRDHGKPGPRPDYGPEYYAAFLKDPDGYRIEAYCSKAPPKP
jgi:catechol 2,3-dioxygenase-like lactoylglutathione lyase family enzyme